MQTVMTTSNGYDSILLVDADDQVVGEWTATPARVMDYLCGLDADAWEENYPDCTSIGDYGTVIGRNGVIDDKARAEFWGTL